MKIPTAVSGASLLVLQAAAHAIEPLHAEVIPLPKRATPQAPNGYAPAPVDCPSSRPTIRPANGLSSQETQWLEKRRNNTVEPLKELLARLTIDGYDTNAFVDNNRDNATALPNIGIAFSGGGYRAMLNGAGNLAAMDSRTDDSTNSGHIGGLLQAATYIAGLSGGSWLVGSIYTNNFTSVQAIINTTPEQSGSLWQLQNSILKGPDQGGFQILDTASYWNNLHDTVDSKADAGFNTSITDYWSRALSFQLVNASDGGPAYTFSSIADDPDFSNANAPMPIIVADERDPGAFLISSNTTVFEFNPFEMGSFDPTLYAFAPLKYTGSNFTSGSIPDSDQCIAGFDNAAYIMGTSSSLFNQALIQLEGTNLNLPDFISTAIQNILVSIGQDSNDIADWTPNPFYQYNPSSNPNAASRRLTLVDGGEDGQNIPLHPLIQPARALDVIFAIDSSADCLNSTGANIGWPNGTSLVATYERSLNASIENGTAFPSIPDQNTFINLGLNKRPTFFGCDASNSSSDTPLIVYLPNAPYVYYSNFTTFTLSYTTAERNAIIQNGYDVATRGNGTGDAQWPQCVACAIMSRSWHKSGEEVPDTCNQCFDRYCWNGTLDSRPVVYNPSLELGDQEVSTDDEGKGVVLTPRGGVVVAVGVAVLAVLV